MIGLLIFGLVILSVICLWILIEQRKSWKFLIWFIPILLVLVTSTYVTYTSILGFPKVTTPEKGMYLKHYVDEPNWIYLWVLSKKNVPMSYQIVYSRKTHEALEGVKGEDQAGDGDERGEEGGENAGGGYTIGGDISFYEWDYSENMPQKDTQQ